MIKRNMSIFIFVIFTILTSGCAERGSNLNVPLKPQTQEKNIETKNEAIPILRLRNSREDQVKQTISGSLILIIGLILFL